MIYKLPGILAPLCPGPCPACMRLLLRNGLTKSNFLSLLPKIGKDQRHCKISNYYEALSFLQIYLLISIQVSINFLSRFSTKCFARLHCRKCPRNLPWFTGLPLLVRGWSLGVYPLTTKFCYVSTLDDVCEIMYQALPTFQLSPPSSTAK